MALKHLKKDIDKLFYYLIKINECKLLIHENTRLSKKYEKDKQNIESKILSNKNYLRDLKCKKLSCYTEIDCIEKDLRESASIIIQYYLRNYLLKNRTYILSENILRQRYIVRKNYIENTISHTIYLNDLKISLKQIEQELENYSHNVNKLKYEELKKLLNKEMYFKNIRLQKSKMYSENIDKYKIVIKEKFTLFITQISNIDSLDRMELNEYIHCLKDKKTKYCTVQLENILKKLLSDSIYNKDILFSFLSKE